MPLPFRTDIPLEVLGAKPADYLEVIARKTKHKYSAVRLANALENFTQELWEVLVRNEADMLGLPNVGPKVLKLLKELLAERGLRLNMLPELAQMLQNVTGARNTNGALARLRSTSELPEAKRIPFAAAGFREGMKARDLFGANASGSLSPEQITFLRTSSPKIAEVLGVSAEVLHDWCHNIDFPFPGTIWDIVLYIAHHVLDDSDTPVIRSAIEAVVGPLPLKLTAAEIRAIRAPAPHRSEHVGNPE